MTDVTTDIGGTCINPNVTIARTRTAVWCHRRNRHSAIQATRPVISIRMSASNAASLSGHHLLWHIGLILEHNLRSAAGQIGRDMPPTRGERTTTKRLASDPRSSSAAQPGQAERDAQAGSWKVIERRWVREVHETNSAM